MDDRARRAKTSTWRRGTGDATALPIRKGVILALIVMLSISIAGLWQSGTAQDAQMGEPPPPPGEINVADLSAAETVDIPASAVSVNTADRAAVAAFFTNQYQVASGISTGWTGSQSSCTPGTTSLTFKQAVAKRINYFRAMAGVPSIQGFSDSYSAQAQQAALMMSRNGVLSHYPSESWACWTEDGYNGAGNSNIALGSFGWNAVTNYMEDGGSNNAAVGHRRWILYPQTQVMGTGDAPPKGSYRGANALWVLDSHTWDSRPAVRDDFVAWPPKGYVPYQVVYPRWSFSYPDADFSGATVSVTTGGTAQTVTIDSSQDIYGDPAIVWRLNGMDDDTPWARPDTDTTYRVRISGVQVNGTAKVFTYDVIVFNPSSPRPSPTPIRTPTAGAATRTPTAGPSPTAYPAGAYCPDAEEQEFLREVNSYRLERGLQPVALDARLGAATRFHAVDMAVAGKLAFKLANGTTIDQNADNHGYEYGVRLRGVASGVADGATMFEIFTDDWVNTFSDPNVEVVGIGRAKGVGSQSTSYYWAFYWGDYLSESASCTGGSAPTATRTATATKTATSTATPTSSATPRQSATPTQTATATATGTIGSSMTPTATATITATPGTSTPSVTLTATKTKTATKTPTKTRTATKTPTRKATATKTPKATKTPTKKPTKTPTAKPTKTPTKKATKTPTKKPTKTPTKRATKTPTKKATATRTKSPTKTPTSGAKQASLDDAVGRVVIEARDREDEVLTGACFALKQDEESVAEACDDQDGVDDGTTEFDGVAPGRYQLVEETTPDGFAQPRPRTITVKADTTRRLTIVHRTGRTEDDAESTDQRRSNDLVAVMIFGAPALGLAWRGIGSRRRSRR